MFDAALRLIGEKGTHNTTLKEVGERAGYSRGLASNRFGSKDEFLTSLSVHINEMWLADFSAVMGGRRGLEAVCGCIDAVAWFLIEKPDYMRAHHILWYESISSYGLVRAKLAVYHRTHRRDMARWVAQAIRDGDIQTVVSPERIALHMNSFFLGTTYQWLVDAANVDIAKTFGEFKDMTVGMIVTTRGAEKYRALCGRRVPSDGVS